VIRVAIVRIEDELASALELISCPQINNLNAKMAGFPHESTVFEGAFGLMTQTRSMGAIALVISVHSIQHKPNFPRSI
jgi:hypothetical protein